MSGDEGFHVAPAILVGVEVRAGDYRLQNPQKFGGDLQIPLVAGLVEGDEDLIAEATGVARNEGGWFRLRAFV